MGGMTSNHEPKDQYRYVHLFLAIRRKKDNDGKKELAFRQIIRDYDKDLALLKYRCELNNGFWRIYRTVNKRDTHKALRQFRHTIIDTEKTNIPSQWRTQLLQKGSKGDRLYLLDIDTKDIDKILKVREIISDVGLDVIEVKETINGFHIVVPPIDVRLFSDLDHVDVLKDGYIFVDSITGVE